MKSMMLTGIREMEMKEVPSPMVVNGTVDVSRMATHRFTFADSK